LLEFCIPTYDIWSQHVIMALKWNQYLMYVA
jgi:hypothetical protein